MSIDVTCPACGGSIQIEEVAEVVACPLCEKHLQVDPETQEPVLVSEETEETEAADPDAPATSEAESETEDQATEEATSAESEAASPFAFLPGANESNSSKKQPNRPANNFSFLPGGTDDSAETVADETTADEAETDETAVDETADTDADTDNDSAITTEETAGLESVHAFAHPTEEEDNDNFDLTETAPEAESAAPFSFVPDQSEESKETDAEAESTTTTSETENPEEEIETPAKEDSAEVAESTPKEETTSAAESAPEESITETASTEEPASEPESPAAPADYRKPKVVSKRLFTLTLTYAIAATIMVAMLLYAKYLGDPHQLESLPDLKPPIKNDEIALQLVPENAELPPGHTLILGGPGRRFGNILVTPLRVTRGPLEFEHYTGDATKTRKPSQDVLKLYLRFENVSTDQTFEPLDQKLLLTRVSGKSQESQLRANNFVSRVDQKRTDGKRVLVYDMPPSWEWNLKDQNINQEEKPQNLEPGESFETYVATNEAGIDDLKGELVWRLQLRKGYNPQSHRGVTTLIEVVFNSDQIETETPSETETPQATS